MSISLGAYLAASPLDNIDTRILAMQALGLTRIQLITQSEMRLSAAQIAALDQLFQRRLAGEPVAYIVGEREFFGLNFYVNPDVLIPRPDTELLVELALQYAPLHASVLDMGTGSGAIAVSLAQQRIDLQVSALDCSLAALSVAQRNAERHLAPQRIRFLQSDWYTNLPPQQFQLILSNPPYIVNQDMHLSQGDLRFEPAHALTDFADGLSAYRTIIGGAATYLASGGHLLLEHGYDQAAAVRDLLGQHGFTQTQSWQDLAGIARVSGGRLP
jgi:release factor glutamine methyltransferase